MSRKCDEGQMRGLALLCVAGAGLWGPEFETPWTSRSHVLGLSERMGHRAAGPWVLSASETVLMILMPQRLVFRWPRS